MRNIGVLFLFILFSTSLLYAQEKGESVFNFDSKIETKKKEKLNESPYAIFGDNTIVLQTRHEEEKDHTLKIPIIENDEQKGVFTLDFQTGMTTILNAEGNLLFEKQLSEEDLARFVTVDPHAEKYYSSSPYVYVNDSPIRFIDPDGKDWIENIKNGNVEWRNNINQDNVPKGYNYIGTEYKGVTITVYNSNDYPTSPENGGHFSQLHIEIGYKDPNTGKQITYNWIQTVERDDSPKFIDPKYGNDNIPFYQDKNTNKRSQNVNGYNAVFFDKPDERTPNGYFNAELSLISSKPVAIQNGNNSYAPNSKIQGRKIYNPIITLNYGFSVKNGVMKPSPVKVVQPSLFQMKAIRAIP